MNNTIIKEEMLPAFQGVVPAIIASSSLDGIPNVTYISQVYYVDDNHVALSRQFFNKTAKNISENPVACVTLSNPLTYAVYKLLLEFIESRREGEVFEEMSLQLEVIAGIQGKSDTFSLLSADIFRIIKIETIYPA